MDFEEMRAAYLRVLNIQSNEELLAENARLKSELDALQQRYDRVLITLQNSVDTVLRVAREGKSDI